MILRKESLVHLHSLIKSGWQENRATFILGILSFLAFVYAYHGTFLWFYERYNNPDSHYSHGYLIPLISGYFIWRKREQLRSIEPKSSRIGLVLVVIALLAHVASVWTHIFFTSGFSILLLFIGLSLYFLGPEFTKKISFPLGFLIFMFPLPMGAIAAFSFPLKLMVSNLAGSLLSVFGFPIFREGAVVHLAKTTLVIDDPCSGIRSLISLLALGALMAYISNTGMLKKLGLFISAIPIAIFTNVLRVCALILAANWLGSEWAMPEHWFHTASGMGVFVISMVLIFLTMRALE
jgi:exosortase A